MVGGEADTVPPYAWSDRELLQACDRQTARAGGPGGQHADRRASAVRLVWRADPRLHASAGELRDQQRNCRVALGRLRLVLALHQRGFADPRWLDRFRAAPGFRIAAAHPDLPLVAAVLLDALDAEEGALQGAAGRCRLSVSRLVRTLALDKQLWQAAQACRARWGLSPLRPPG